MPDDAECIFVGFWTDKGTCDDNITAFLNKLENKKVFLFGTAGFGGEQRLIILIKHYLTQIQMILQHL